MLFWTGLSKTNLDFRSDFRGKFEHTMTTKEIEKLRDKVVKDPNSKLYVPLAEEYRKEGRLDEAIEVLQRGLERQPGYMSARVSLGKIYLEKGQLEEARSEFENVIKSVPDNLYAHKKLAEIYRSTGNKERAIKAFRTYLKLYPMDEDALNNLRVLEGGQSEQPAETMQASGRLPEAAEEEAFFEPMDSEQMSHEQAQREPAESGKELEAFKESLLGFQSEEGKEIPEESRAAAEDTLETPEIPDKADEVWSFGEVKGTPAEEAAQQDTLESADIPDEADAEWSFGEEESGPAGGADEELSFGDMGDLLRAEGVDAAEGSTTLTEEMYRPKPTPADDAVMQHDSLELLQSADRLITEENFSGAIGVYQQILAAAPGDKRTLQRIEELRALLKLMGKDKEVLVSRLNAFLSAIRKRGDEFHRSP
jgi:tetratricopeptide (TPR) repeat protein